MYTYIYHSTARTKQHQKKTSGAFFEFPVLVDETTRDEIPMPNEPFTLDEPKKKEKLFLLLLVYNKVVQLRRVKK